MEDTGIFTTLNVNPEGQTSVNFYFFIVELLEGSTLTFSEPDYQPAEGENPASVSYTADYGDNPPADSAPYVAYMLPFLQQYQDPTTQDNPIDLSGATLMVYEKGKDNPKVKGTVQGIKTTQRPGIPPSDFVDTVPGVNEIRYCIATYNVSTTDTQQFFLVAMSKTDKASHSNHLQIKEKSSVPTTLKADFQAQTNTAHNSGNVCSIGFIPAPTKSADRYQHIWINGVEGTWKTIKYDEAHKVNCNAINPENSL